MLFLKSIIKDYNKGDIYALLVIFAMILIMLYFSWLKWLHPVIDCGREVYVPWQILDGKILYKDIAYYYGPLAPYLTALFFKICGANLNVIYAIGIFVNIWLCVLVYLLSRQLLGALTSCLVVGIFIQVASIAPNLGSYEGFIFPYSFAALFGLLFIILQIFFLLEYYKHNNLNILYFSAFFASLSISCKQDYALSSLLITLAYLIYLFKKRTSLKTLGNYVLYTLLIPLCAYGVFLFFVPVNVYLSKYLLPSYILVSEYSKTTVVSFFSFYHLWISVKNFLYSAMIILIMSTITYVLIWITTTKLVVLVNKYRTKVDPIVIYAIIFSISVIIITEILDIIIKNLPFLEQNLNHIHYISWYPVFIGIVLLYYTYKHFFLKLAISEKDNIFCLLAVAGVLVSIRCFAYCFTSYLLMPLLIVVIYLYTVKLPAILQKNKFINSQNAQNATISVLIIFIIVFAAKNIFTFSKEVYSVETPYGTFKTFKPYADGFNSAIFFIQQYLNKNDMITVFPEETLINFLTRHPSPTVMNQYMDINNIMLNKNELQLNTELLKRSKYIFVSNFPYFLEQKYYFGENYHRDLANWIKKTYVLTAQAGKYELIYEGINQNYGFLIYATKHPNLENVRN